jgi:hypothetical protein
MMNEKFKGRAIGIRPAVALDNEILSWTMPTVIKIVGNFA